MEEQRRQFVKYDFCKFGPMWRRLVALEKEENQRKFRAVVDELSSEGSILSYNLVGIRCDCDVLLWNVFCELDQLQELVTLPWSTGLGKSLEIPYSHLAMRQDTLHMSAHTITLARKEPPQPFGR